MIIFTLAEFKGPRVPLQEIIYCLLNRYTGIKASRNWLPCYGICFPVSLNVLLDGSSFIGLSTISHYWIFHQFEGDLAHQMVRNLKDYLFVSCVQECLQLMSCNLAFKTSILIKVFLRKPMHTLYSLIASILLCLTSSNCKYHKSFLAR